MVGVVTVSFELLASSYARRQQVAPISTIGAAARLSSSIFWLQPSQVASLVVSAAVMESLIAGYLYHRPINMAMSELVIMAMTFKPNVERMDPRGCQ